MRGEPIRAAVVSDTHGLLRPEVEQVIQSCDVVIHAGDFDNQMLYHKLNIRQPLYGVRGNNDGDWARQLPLVRRFELGGVKMMMAHDRADVPSAGLGEAQVVIFGHSHQYFHQEIEGRIWLNPGSCGYPRFHLPLSLAVMTIDQGQVQVEPIWLSPPVPEQRKEEEKEEKNESWTGRLKRLSGGVRGNKDELFFMAKIMRFMRRGDTAEWVAGNLKTELSFVEEVYRICLTHPGVDARGILDKMEVNHLQDSENNKC